MPNPKMNFLSPEAQQEYAKMTTSAKSIIAAPELQSKSVDGQSLSQSDMDRYIELCKAYSGVMIPLEIQLEAWVKYGEPPSGITLDTNIVGDMSVVDYLREILELRKRKTKYGVDKGVVDPDAIIELKQRAVVIYTRCALEIAESEVKGETGVRWVFFPAPAGAKLGRNGYIPLFPGYKDSPVGKFRGDGAAFNAQECVNFIGKHFPEIEDEMLNSLADA